MADIELSVLSRQCLDRRIGNRDAFAKEVSVWIKETTPEKRSDGGLLQLTLEKSSTRSILFIKINLKGH